MRPALPLTLLALAALAGACGFEQQTTIHAPSSPTPASSGTGGSASSGPMVGTWTSDTGLTIPDVSTCGNFQWQIADQSETSLSGTFSASCGGSLTIMGSGTGSMASADSVNVSVTGTAIVGGFAACSFAVSGVGVVTNNDTLTIPYSGTTCLGPVRGTETLRRRSNAPAPEPPPEEPPAPPPPPPPATPAPDGFDLGSVTVVGSPDVRGWPVTSRITSLAFRPGTIHLDHTRRGTWPPVVIAPDGTTQESTLWVFFHINGRWSGTGAERWRPSQTDKALTKPSDIGPGWLYDPSRWGPMANYVPRPGELVGFMVAAGSTRSDANVAVAERSAVILIPFPADGQVAQYPPFAWEE
jgi:hypothetical protein